MVQGNVRAIVLAAGKSKRFKRKRNKLISKICGRAMVLFPLKVLEKLAIPTSVVLGHHSNEVTRVVDEAGVEGVSYVLQHEQLGTGNAVLCSAGDWDKDHILVLNGDVPLLTPKVVEGLLESHEETNALVSLVSTHALSPKSYGRVVENDGGVSIYEEKDCPDEYKDVTKVNAGIYVINRSFLEGHIQKLEKSEVSGEFYLTDLVALAGEEVNVVPAPFDTVRGVNTLRELWAVEQIMRSNLIKYWMANGVRFEMAQSTHIDIDVTIGADTSIGTGVHLRGRTKVGEGCLIDAFCVLENSSIGDDTTVYSHSVIQDSAVGCEVEIGPFARLRGNAVLFDKACVGNFVEVKNSAIGKGSKAKHLAYLGDATVGMNANVGAGTIVCNYDGHQKHKTIIEDEVFVGSNNTLVAPLRVGREAYLAAGSTITKNVPPQDLAIARARQENKEKYACKLRKRVTGPCGAKKTEDASVCQTKQSCKKKDNVTFHFLGAFKHHEGPEETL